MRSRAGRRSDDPDVFARPRQRPGSVPRHGGCGRVSPSSVRLHLADRQQHHRDGTRPCGTPPADLETAWGFMAGKAPPGTSALTVAANGTTFIRGNCYAYSGGHAGGSIYAFVEEFVPVGTPCSGPPCTKTTSRFVDNARSRNRRRDRPRSTSPGRGTRRKRLDSPPQPDDGCARVASIRSRYPPRRDDAGHAGHAGNWYRWWIACYQYVGVATPGCGLEHRVRLRAGVLRLHRALDRSDQRDYSRRGRDDAHPDAFRTISVGSWSASSSFTAKPAASCRPAGSCRLPASSAPRPGRRRIGRRPVFQLEPVGESHSVLLRQSAGTERPP